MRTHLLFYLLEQKKFKIQLKFIYFLKYKIFMKNITLSIRQGKIHQFCWVTSPLDTRPLFLNTVRFPHSYILRYSKRIWVAHALNDKNTSVREIFDPPGLLLSSEKKLNSFYYAIIIEHFLFVYISIKNSKKLPCFILFKLLFSHSIENFFVRGLMEIWPFFAIA